MFLHLTYTIEWEENTDKDKNFKHKLKKKGKNTIFKREELKQWILEEDL